MNKSCRFCNKEFEITNEDLAFYEKISPSFPSAHSITSGQASSEQSNNKKYLIPPPTLCPKCRQQRRMCFRNERNLYQRKCSLCNKDIITIFSDQGPIKNVFCGDCYNSDKWDALDYGRDFDFSRSFFDQFKDLLFEVPQKSLMTVFNENCDYTNQSWHSKDSYLCFDLGYGENCFYSNASHFTKSIVDCSYCKESEILYECVDCKNCYNSYFSEKCENCSDSLFCFDCKGCSNCILCSNLRQGSYCIRNKKVSKEEFEKFYKEFYTGNHSFIKKIKEEFKNLKLNSIHKENYNMASDNCSGENIMNSKNCFRCFDIFRSEDCKFCNDIDNDIKDSQDITNGAEGELLYDSLSVAGYNNSFCRMFTGKNSLYSMNSFSSSNDQYLFGCCDLRNKEYCILNKQYTKEEYEKLVPRIIEHMSINSSPDKGRLGGVNENHLENRTPSNSPLSGREQIEWGEFFPPNLSPFGYNETVANEYYPLTKQEVETCHGMSLQDKFNWSDYEPPKLEVKKTIPANKLPDSIDKIPDDILNWAILCEITGKPFKIIKQELKFYREHNLPIPRRHPDQRHRDRLSLRNPRKLFERKCDKCNKDIQTTYSPERKEIVYCEDCYLKEVY